MAKDILAPDKSDFVSLSIVTAFRIQKSPFARFPLAFRARANATAAGKYASKYGKKDGPKEELPEGNAPAPGPPYVEIPKKYASPKTSGLSVTVTLGAQIHDFELTD